MHLALVSATGPEKRQLSDPTFAIENHYHLKRFREFVDGNLSKAFQLPEAASFIGLSPSRLSHLFADQTGMRCSDWIRFRRIEAASAMLSSNNRFSILGVALATGYKNIRSFERAFKKTTGLTPTKFRTATTAQNLSPIQRNLSPS